MKFNKILLTSSIAIVLSACASKPSEISSTYVSPLKYHKYDCDQIITEMDYVSRRTTTLYSSLKKKSDNDSAAMGIGLVLFWPALFFLEGGDGPEAVEYANLKGEFEALRTASVEKKCTKTLPKSPEEIIQEKAEQEKMKKGPEKAGGVH